MKIADCVSDPNSNPESSMPDPGPRISASDTAVASRAPLALPTFAVRRSEIDAAAITATPLATSGAFLTRHH
jgi:hypothetical protein